MPTTQSESPACLKETSPYLEVPPCDWLSKVANVLSSVSASGRPSDGKAIGFEMEDFEGGGEGMICRRTSASSAGMSLR